MALGLGLDAYVAFRLFPVVPLVSGLALLLARRGDRRSLVAGGVIAGVGMLLVYAPLALFFIQHPEWFFGRFSQTTASTLDSAHLAMNLISNGLKTLGGLVVSGDANWRQNLAGRPALDVVQALFGLAGLAALAWRRYRAQAASLLVWLLVGLAPSVVTAEAPHFGRTTMVTPAIALIIGLGLYAAWNCSRRYRLLQIAIVIAGLLSVAWTASAYFGTWAHNENLFGAFDLEQVGVAQTLMSAPSGSALYAANLPISPWTVEYVMGTAAFQRVNAYDSANCLVLPTPASEPAAYAVVNPKGSPLLPALQRAYPAASWTVRTMLVDQPFIGLFQIPSGQAPLTPVAVERSADFGGFVRMLGYTLTTDDLKPGGALTIHVVWQIEQKTQTSFKTFTHLLGTPQANGDPIYSQRDSQPCDDSYPTTGWNVGDLLAGDYALDLPADLPTGTYTVQIGWYDSVSGARAPVSGDAGPHQNDAAHLQQVVVNRP